MNHWADSSYNLDLGYLKPQSPKVFLELLSSNDLRHDWCLEATQAAQIAVTASYLFPEGRLTKLTHIPRECEVPDLPPARACITLTSPGSLTAVYPSQSHEFIKSPWGEQVLSALTSQLAVKQPYFIISSYPTIAGSFVTPEACTGIHFYSN